MSANIQQTDPDDTVGRRRKLCQSINTLPPNEASKGFETLLRSYDHGSSGSFADMKEEGVFDLALDLMDPPPEKPYNRQIWFLCLSTIKMCTGYLLHSADRDVDLAARIKHRMASCTRRAWSIITTSEDLREAQVTRYSFVIILANITLVYEDDEPFYRELRDSCSIELAMLCWATPVMGLKVSDQVSYFSHCYDIFKRTSSVPSTEEIAVGIEVDEENPTLSPTAIQVCKNTGAPFYEERILRALRYEGMVDVNLFLAIDMINGYFLVESLKVQFLLSPIIGRILEKLSDHLRYGKERSIDEAMFQATVKCFHTALFPAEYFENPPDNYEAAVSKLCNHPGFMPFFAKGMLVLTGAKDHRSVLYWEEVARCLYQQLKSKPNEWFSSSPHTTPDTKFSLIDYWYDVYFNLNLVDPDNKLKPASLELWKRFAWKFGLDELKIIHSHRQTTKKIRQRGGGGVATVGCGWFMCPLWGVETISDPLECRSCGRAFYCSDYCHKRDWENHQRKCQLRR